MSILPLIAHYRPDPSAELLLRTDQLADELSGQHTDFQIASDFHSLVPQTLVDGPTLFIDDLSEISELNPVSNHFFQDRARLRAGDGDVVVTATEPIAGYEDYLKDYLGLGSPTWLRVKPAKNPLRLADAVWEDRSARRELVRRLRHRQLSYMHPHMGCFPVWELATLLHCSSHRPLQMIAAPPAVCRWANDKVAFTDVVTRLFGSRFVPMSRSAWNLATAAHCVQELANRTDQLVVKVPDSAGGGGNVVVPADQVRRKSLQAIRSVLKRSLTKLQWAGERPLLISAWEANVQCSPSAQLWIPPTLDGIPIVEGVFLQSIVSGSGAFVGNRPATFGDQTTQEIVDRSWLLGRLFQRLGYVGRCSFDLILTNTAKAKQQIEFIECNGRWGGTSLPMTLMNRIFGDWKRQPYAVNICHVPGIDQLSFAQLLKALGPELYDQRTGKGGYILFNGSRVANHAGVAVIALADDWKTASVAACVEFSARLSEIAKQHAIDQPEQSAI